MKTIKSGISLLLTVTCLVLFYYPLYAQQTASQRYEKALYIEEAKGELQQAIDLYQKIVKDNPESRPVAAKAQFHIGLCYEKLGLKQAQKAYKKVLDNYPEQTEAVKLANKKLSLLLSAETVIRKEDKGIVIKQIWEGRDMGGFSQVSPDGKYISYVHWDTGDLAVYDIKSGEKKLITNKGSWDDSSEYAMYSYWSPDSKQLLCVWNYGNEELKADLRIIGIDGSNPRTLCSVENENFLWAESYDWSSDGKYILAAITKADTSTSLELISTKDGSFKTLRKLGNHFIPDINQIKISPDGKAIAYDYPDKDNTSQNDIYIVSSQTGEVLSVLKNPVHEIVFDWAPGSNDLVFLSRRTGSFGLWKVQFVDNKYLSEPELIKPIEGVLPPHDLGITNDGTIYYIQWPGRTNIYMAKLDSRTGKLIDPPRELINHYVGSNATPEFSPDGKSLVYISRRGFMGSTSRPVGNVLCIRSLETGKEKIIYPDLDCFGFPKWSPDGQTVMVANWERDNQHMGLYLIDLNTGKSELVFSTLINKLTYHEWGMDANHYFIVQWEKGYKQQQLLLRHIDSDESGEIIDDSRGYLTLSRSPDGTKLAIYDSGNDVLKWVPINGGEVKEIYAFKQKSNNWVCIEWTADGDNIIIPRLRPPYKDNSWDFWLVPVNEGEPLSMGLETTAIWQISTHPDGSHIAFSNMGSEPESIQIWAIENCLPPEGKAAK